LRGSRACGKTGLAGGPVPEAEVLDDLSSGFYRRRPWRVAASYRQHGVHARPQDGLSVSLSFINVTGSTVMGLFAGLALVRHFA